MELNRDAQADTSQVEDLRGAGGSGGGLGGLGGGRGGLSLPIGGGRGGIIGLIVGLIVVLAGGGYGATQIFGGSGGTGAGASDCSTANPNRVDDLACRNELYITSIQAFWQTELPQVYGTAYQQSHTVFFSQRVSTGCGAADSGMGPFYCPPDKKVYIDLSFYDELVNRFGAKGEFAQPYVLAHEYGHHVQDLLGTMAQVDRLQQRDPGGANRYSVALELQADCLAGVWAKHATGTADAAGRPIITSVTAQDIQDAVTAAGTVGDDAIAKQAGQRVNPDAFTHGSSAQRQKWVSTGYRTGDPKSCDTFAGL